MVLEINGMSINHLPVEFSASVMDVDDGETTFRAADSSLCRNRLGVKRKISLKFGVLKWEDISYVLGLMTDEFFELYYPDPETGQYETKTFYASDRTAAIAVSDELGIMWKGLTFTLTER